MYDMKALTEVDHLLLDALHKDEWRTRAEIAMHLPPPPDGEPKPLNQYDVQRLEGLVSSGYVERSERQYTRVRKVYIYRLRGA